MADLHRRALGVGVAAVIAVTVAAAPVRAQTATSSTTSSTVGSEATSTTTSALGPPIAPATVVEFSIDGPLPIAPDGTVTVSGTITTGPDLCDSYTWHPSMLVFIGQPDSTRAVGVARFFVDCSDEPQPWTAVVDPNGYTGVAPRAFGNGPALLEMAANFSFSSSPMKFFGVAGPVAVTLTGGPEAPLPVADPVEGTAPAFTG